MTLTNLFKNKKTRKGLIWVLAAVAAGALAYMGQKLAIFFEKMRRNLTPARNLPKDWVSIRYFKPAEFDSPDQPGSGEIHMNLAFVGALDNLRHEYGKPVRVSSGFRTKARNASISGASAQSYHMKGCAADLSFTGFSDALKFWQLACEMGFRGMGFYRTKRANGNGYFIHLDTGRVTPGMWFGKAGTSDYLQIDATESALVQEAYSLHFPKLNPLPRAK